MKTEIGGFMEAVGTTEENKMGTKPVWSLLMTMALPVVLSTAVQSLYNVVDGIFVSQISEDAMAAITFANPLVTILIAVGSGIAVGMNTMLSHGLGEKDQQGVNDSASAAIWLILLCGMLSLLAGLFLVQPYMAFQTKDAQIRAAGVRYLQVYFCMGVATIAQLVFERMLISNGKTMYSMGNVMKITVGNTIFTATLENNSSVEALKEILMEGPLTINMSDYGNMEKVGPIGTSLPENNEQITTGAGDIILYQGNSLVIYYDTNSWNFTRLGKINDVTQEELKEALGNGDITATLTLE